MTKQIAGPASLALAALVARRYYLDERSKVEIAGELGLSRFKIARMLDLRHGRQNLEQRPPEHDPTPGHGARDRR